MTDLEILEAIRRWSEVYGEPPTMADWDPYRARQLGQEWRIARYDQGRWPSAKTVRNHFGRMSTAVARAGLTPRQQGQRRPRDIPPIDEQTMLHMTRVRRHLPGDPNHIALASAVREVSRAHSSARDEDLRVALIELAATALSWASDAVGAGVQGA